MACRSCSLLLVSVCMAALWCCAAQGASNYPANPMSVPLRVPIYQGGPAGPMTSVTGPRQYAPPPVRRMTPSAPLPNTPNPYLSYGCTPQPRKVFDPVSAMFSAITLPVRLVSRIVNGSPVQRPQIGPAHGCMPMRPPGMNPVHPPGMPMKAARPASRADYGRGPVGY